MCIGIECGCCDEIRRRPGVGGVPPFEYERVRNGSEKCQDYAYADVVYI